ncbi:MAG: DNA-binding protein [Rhodospirillales bacterium]|nr:DNA-binding protein [Rhodospirillales bacterium]
MQHSERGQSVDAKAAKPDLWIERDSALHLIAGRRVSDGRVVFPMPQGGEAENYTPLELPPTGALWSFTVQRFQPKSPFVGATTAPFAPYAVGYVEFPGLVIVEGRIVIDDFENLKIGMPMRVVTDQLVSADSARTIFAFSTADAIQ